MGYLVPITKARACLRGGNAWNGIPGTYQSRRDDRAAIDRFYELLVFAVLSYERWLFVNVEPDLGGATHPEFVMAVPPAFRRVLVEVKTVHRATALVPSDEAQRTFEALLSDRLAKRGYECKTVTLHALPGQVPAADQHEAMVDIILGQLRRSLLKPRAAFSVELPTGAKLDLLLSDPGFRGPSAGRLFELEKARFSVSRMFHETFRYFDEQKGLRASYGNKIPARIGKAAAQIEKSKGDLPSIVAIAVSDSSWTIRGTLDAVRDDLRERQADRPGPVALLLVSFFQPKPEPIPDAPDWVKASEFARWRGTLVLGAHAAWVRLQDTAPTMSHIWTFDANAPKAIVTVPPLPVTPKPVGSRNRRPATRRRKKD